MKITLDTLVIDLYQVKETRLTAVMANRLANALAVLYGKIPENISVIDLLRYYPVRYEDRSNLLSIDLLEDGLDASVDLLIRNSTATQVGKNRSRNALPLIVFEISGGDAMRQNRPVIIKWFISGKNARSIADWYLERFKRGNRVIAHGRWERDNARQTFVLKVSKPDELELLPVNFPADEMLFNEPKPTPDGIDDENDSAEFNTIHTARRVPIYRKLATFTPKRLREIIFTVLEKIENKDLKESLPRSVVRSNDLLSFGDALRQMHFPDQDSSLADYQMFRSDAQRRLIFEELFELTFALRVLRGERQREARGTIVEITDRIKERLNAAVPFPLTNAQKRVIGDIFSDLKSESPMHRLLQGDVGSGKTIVAFLSMFAVMENGYQTALMAPTEILAEQHARNAKAIFEPAGYRIAYLSGGLAAKEKREIKAAIENAEVDLVIGTHALIQDSVKFDRLGMAVIDEQHRFGVVQRAHLASMGDRPDILVMTATPIPRSLAMTAYGDLDVSVIDEMPPGRTPVKTVVLAEKERDGVYRGIEREVELGSQVYFVCPLVTESEKLDLKAAEETFADLRDNIFPHRRVGLIHGRMKPADKETVMADFVAGKTDILVATTVIEVGVDVPNASLMVIEHAERFGLSQLHQLRGRVGRGSQKSFCVLLTGFKQTSAAKERLGIMEATSDGFKIAEKDLEIRGEGEVLGTRQAGIHNFRIANLARDLDILTAARKAADQLLSEQPWPKEIREMIAAARGSKRFRLGSIG